MRKQAGGAGGGGGALGPLLAGHLPLDADRSVLGSRQQEPSVASVHLAEPSTEGVKGLGGYSFLSQEQHPASFFL